MHIFVEGVEKEVSWKILNFFQHSLYVKTLTEISNEEIRIDLRSEKEWIALHHLVDWTTKDLNQMNLIEISQYKDEINYLFEFYMIPRNDYHYNYHYVDEKIKMYEDFDFYEMMESPDLQEYFFQRVLYMPHRKKVSFFPFLNSFLLHKDRYGKVNFYRFLRVFNEYAKRMNWLKDSLLHFYFSFNPFQMKDQYSKEDFCWIEEMLFPKEIFQIMDEGYDSHQKVCECMNLTDEQSDFMKDLILSRTVILAGSSIMYLTLRDYPRDQMNDIDIWYLDRDRKNQAKAFVDQLQDIFDTSTMNYKVRRGIVDLHFEETNTKIQILNTQQRDGYSIIDHFDFGCVRAFLNNKVNGFVFTTDFCESIIHRKLNDAYDIQNMVRQFSYLIQKRINKYHERGFELSPYLHSVLQDYEPNPDIDRILQDPNSSRLSIIGNGKIPFHRLRHEFHGYFTLNDMQEYADLSISTVNLLHEYLYHVPSLEVLKYNHHIFQKYFYEPYTKKYPKCDVSILLWNHELSREYPTHYPFVYSKIILINYENGEIWPYFKSYLPLPIEEILEKYKLDHFKIDQYIIFVNYSSSYI